MESLSCFTVVDKEACLPSHVYRHFSKLGIFKPTPFSRRFPSASTMKGNTALKPLSEASYLHEVSGLEYVGSGPVKRCGRLEPLCLSSLMIRVLTLGSTWWKQSTNPCGCPLTGTGTPWHMYTCTCISTNTCKKYVDSSLFLMFACVWNMYVYMRMCR